MLIFLGIAVAVGILIFSASVWGPNILLKPDRRSASFYQERYGYSSPPQIGLTHESCSFVTRDGLRISYWIINSNIGNYHKGDIIYLHGITDSKVSGLNYAKFLTEEGWRVIIPDLRRHGESEGEYCTYGYHEKYDVSQLIDDILKNDSHNRVILLGISMGGAIGIQTAAIDERIAGVIAVAPFYDLFSIALDHQAKKIGIRNKLLLKRVLEVAGKRASFNYNEVSPAKVMPALKTPILIVHGTKDRTVKIEYSRRLATMSSNARLLLVPDAGHTDVLEIGGEEYMNELLRFISLAINGESPV
ncbi:MAG: alpha/beta hydrolase [Candidatus Kryptoniota bacterium]